MIKQLLLTAISFLGWNAIAQDTCFVSAGLSYVIDGDNVTFTNTSTGDSEFATYDWSISDLSSTDENPTFSTVGFEAYETVCLTVFDSTFDCSDSICTTIYFGVDEEECDLEASFTYEVEDGIVTFTNTSTDEPDDVHYSWSFEGGTPDSSTEENPSLSVTGWPEYVSVCFTVHDSLYECMDTYCFTITTASTDCGVTADFTYTLSGGMINFTNTSIGDGVGSIYDWSIAGLSSTEENPSFSTAGFGAEEEVCLIVSDDSTDCIDTLCMIISIEEDSCSLAASYTYTISGGIIDFTNTSTGTSPTTNYDWWIDDLSSTEENPSFITAGFEAYEEVCLIVWDDSTDCMDTLCMIIYFGEDSCTLAASYTYTISGGIIDFTNTSTGTSPTTNYDWWIDGLTSSEENPSFITAGFEAYEDVCLIVWDDSTGCIDTLCTVIYFEEDSCLLAANYTYTISGGIIDFTNTSIGTSPTTNYDWWIDDLSSTEENPSFSTAGFEAYEEVCLIVWDDSTACMDTLCTIIYFGEDSCSLTASYTYTISGGIIDFTNTSIGASPTTNYDWSVGGLTSTEENPSFITAGFEAYEEACLIAWDDSTGCIDTVCTLIFFDYDSCFVDADFTFAQYGANVHFTNTSTGEPAEAFYNWFVDGVLTSTEENPIIGTDIIGEYSYVCLEIHDSLYMCYDSICKPVFSDTLITDSTAYIYANEKLEFNLYPNPATSSISIAINDTKDNQEILIFNGFGQIVKKEKIKVGEINKSLDIEELANGIYIIQLINENSGVASEPKRFVKR